MELSSVSENSIPLQQMPPQMPQVPPQFQDPHATAGVPGYPYPLPQQFYPTPAMFMNQVRFFPLSPFPFSVPSPFHFSEPFLSPRSYPYPTFSLAPISLPRPISIQSHNISSLLLYPSISLFPVPCFLPRYISGVAPTLVPFLVP